MANDGGERLRQLRQARGLGAADLAERAGLSRQALSAIERGDALPRVDTAIRLARALDVDVETLFAPPAEVSLPDGVGVTARVHGREVRLALTGEDALPALVPVPDMANPNRGGAADLVLAGCDPFAAWLGARIEARAACLRVVHTPRGSRAALEALRDGKAHAAGVHAGSTEANAALCRAVLGEPFVLVDWVGWRMGLVASRPDLFRSRHPDVVVRREHGAAARTLLDGWLRARGIAAAEAGPTVRSHAAVLQTVAALPGAIGATCEPLAALTGMPFQTLREERYQFCVRQRDLGEPELQALLSTLAEEEFDALQAVQLDTQGIGAIHA